MSIINSDAVDLDFELQPASPAAPPRIKLRTPRVPLPFLDRNSLLFQTLRWVYQPVRAIKELAIELRESAQARRVIADYLARPGFKGLHVGCGPFHLAGWLNSELRREWSHTDFVQDITRRFPLPDECLDAIYGCEVIEHLPRAGMLSFLRESYRVLRDGGVMRLTTPDVVECCRLFLGLRDDVKLEQFRAVWIGNDFSPETWINSQFSAWGHQHLYSFAELSDRLTHAGFRKVIRCEPHQSPSNIAQLKHLETRYGRGAPEWLWAKTMIVEAIK